RQEARSGPRGARRGSSCRPRCRTRTSSPPGPRGARAASRQPSGRARRARPRALPARPERPATPPGFPPCTQSSRRPPVGSSHPSTGAGHQIHWSATEADVAIVCQGGGVAEQLLDGGIANAGAQPVEPAFPLTAGGRNPRSRALRTHTATVLALMSGQQWDDCGAIWPAADLLTRYPHAAASGCRVEPRDGRRVRLGQESFDEREVHLANDRGVLRRERSKRAVGEHDVVTVTV